jgi:hypothetical protein
MLMGIKIPSQDGLGKGGGSARDITLFALHGRWFGNLPGLYSNISKLYCLYPRQVKGLHSGLCSWNVLRAPADLVNGDSRSGATAKERRGVRISFASRRRTVVFSRRMTPGEMRVVGLRASGLTFDNVVGCL